MFRKDRPPERVDTKYDITNDLVNAFIDDALKGEIENAALWGAESTFAAVMALETCVSGRDVTWKRVART
jgi:hypothetical protein